MLPHFLEGGTVLIARGLHVNQGCVNVTQKDAIKRFGGETKDTLRVSIVHKRWGAQLGRRW